MPKETMERGPTSERVSENLRALRKARGLDLADVSDELAALGQPIGISGLSKVELGQRRVDVDELVALSQVLKVSVHQLLFDSPLRERVKEANYEALAAEIEAAKLRGALQEAEARAADAKQRWQQLTAELDEQEAGDGNDGEHQ